MSNNLLQTSLMTFNSQYGDDLQPYLNMVKTLSSPQYCDWLWPSNLNEMMTFNRPMTFNFSVRWWLSTVSQQSSMRWWHSTNLVLNLVMTFKQPCPPLNVVMTFNFYQWWPLTNFVQSSLNILRIEVSTGQGRLRVKGHITTLMTFKSQWNDDVQPSLSRSVSLRPFPLL